MYKLVFLSLFLISAQAALLDTSIMPDGLHLLQEFQRGIDVVQKTVKTRLSRHRRDSSLSNLMCVNRCAQSMAARLKDEVGIDSSDIKSSILVINPRFLEENGIDNYCQITSQGKSCIDRCGSVGYQFAQVMRVINNAFSVHEYICVTNREDFNAAIPCYKKAQSAVTERCDNVCGNQAELLERSDRSLKYAALFKNLTLISKVLDDVCKFLSCANKCHNPVITEVCDGNKKPGELLNGVTHLSMRVTQDVFEMLESMGAVSNLWPQSCRNLAQGGEKGISQIVDEEEEEDE